MKDWLQDRPSRKLSHTTSGPYKIIEKVRNAYKLDLPQSINVHPVFNPSKLRKAASTEPLTGQHTDPPPPIQYRVQWLGHDLDPAWYPAGNFKNAPEMIKEFHDAYPAKPGPPMRLQEWIEAAQDDRILDDHVDDEKPAFRD
ncbi:hypothetical protein DTO013E5_2326 [Penicillium roqueforti]|nr:hypothetical protein DTO012A1_2662 [Penicillium roqueforti]KAI2745080.1 hypothetical protein DTO013F2_7534 [Penicillium roqueforti]KAI2763233.1 hypothetical protein DTO012A8_9554 [Penicillium roqueforti]KAI3178818.1 hypothetical protein DTO046C5_2079 [Penicillium roqueforti]KAI3215763.1 hypothetical protein DTO013E5_2326 [Penicillium roqueforti]